VFPIPENTNAATIAGLVRTNNNNYCNSCFLANILIGNHDHSVGIHNTLTPTQLDHQPTVTWHCISIL
jgi:hypothetical protein